MRTSLSSQLRLKGNYCIYTVSLLLLVENDCIQVIITIIIVMIQCFYLPSLGIEVLEGSAYM